jgi:hypothetical protein
MALFLLLSVNFPPNKQQEMNMFINKNNIKQEQLLWIMELSPSCAVTQERSGILWSPKFHYRVHNSSLLIPIQPIPFHPISLSCISILSTHLSLSLPSGLFLHGFPTSMQLAGRWRELHNEELRDLYSSPSIIRIIMSWRMGWAGHVARIGRKWNVYRLLVEKPEGKWQLGRQRRKWADNIKMDLAEMGWGWYGLDWSGSG